MYDVLANLVSWQFGIGFLVGLATHRGYCWIKARRLDRENPLPNNRHHKIGGISRIWLAGVIAVGTLAYSLTETQENSSRVQNLARETQECQREFTAALTARARITSENDELSQAQRRIVFNWIHDLIFPPPPYDVMVSDDPRRQDYGLTLTINTERDFQASLQRQDELQAERDKHPLPDPTCGK